jgi:probable phosphoglycerate mutase
MDRFNNHPELWHIEGCELFPDLRTRLRHAIDEIIRAHPGQKVAVTSHGMAIRALL